MKLTKTPTTPGINASGFSTRCFKPESGFESDIAKSCAIQYALNVHIACIYAFMFYNLKIFSYYVKSKSFAKGMFQTSEVSSCPALSFIADG